MNLTEIAPNLAMSPEGWWNARSVSGVSYPDDGNSVCFAVEDSSFWFRHRNRCILEAIRLFPPPGTFFDVGGGNGYVARELQEQGIDVVLFEPGLAGVRNAVKRGVRNVVRGTLEDAGVRPESVPAAGLFDVVEHIDEDVVFLRGIHDLMALGGRAYITVPAHAWLWSEEDRLAGHARRYTVSNLTAALEQSGFQVEFATYFFSFLMLPIFVGRALPHMLGFRKKEIVEDQVRSDHQVQNPAVSKFLEKLTSNELAKLARGRKLSRGASCLAVARRAA